MHSDTSYDESFLQISGQVSRDVLEAMFERIIKKYFFLEHYYRIDGKPVFSVFYYPSLIAGLGGVEQTRDALDWMHRRCEEFGLPGLHIQAIAWHGSGGIEAGATVDDASIHTVGSLGFDSATSYQYSQDAGTEGDYVSWAHKSISAWEDYETAFGTYFPHASIGWDNTQRNPSITSAVSGATPDAFEACLWKARRYLDARPQQTPLITINSWNEWTEGSYLLPDMRWGYRYLRAVRNVFG
jgi:hypothetical protein